MQILNTRCSRDSQKGVSSFLADKNEKTHQLDIVLVTQRNQSNMETQRLKWLRILNQPFNILPSLNKPETKRLKA